MPELPDVEVRRIYLEKHALRQPVRRVRVVDKRILGDATPSSLGRALKNKKFIRADRRGKYLLVPTSDDHTLLMHLGMTGDLIYQSRSEKPPDFHRVIYYLGDDSSLYYLSKRMLGKVDVYPTRDYSEIPDIAKLGPEPLDPRFTGKDFAELISSRTTDIHKVLMDQTLIAGIGNIYSDEICFQAGIRPDRKANALSAKELENLYLKMRWVLRKSIEMGAELDDEADRFIIPHRHQDMICPRCGGGLEAMKIGGRTSYFCPRDQK